MRERFLFARIIAVSMIRSITAKRCPSLKSDGSLTRKRGPRVWLRLRFRDRAAPRRAPPTAYLARMRPYPGSRIILQSGRTTPPKNLSCAALNVVHREYGKMECEMPIWALFNVGSAETADIASLRRGPRALLDLQKQFQTGI